MAVAVLALALLTVLFRAGPAIANEMADGMNYVVVNPDLNRLREDSAWRDSQIFVTPGCGYDTASDRISGRPTTDAIGWSDQIGAYNMAHGPFDSR